MKRPIPGRVLKFITERHVICQKVLYQTFRSVVHPKAGSRGLHPTPPPENRSRSRAPPQETIDASQQMQQHAPAGRRPPARPPPPPDPAAPRIESVGPGPHARGGHARSGGTRWPLGGRAAADGARLPVCARRPPVPTGAASPAPRGPPRAPSGR